MTPLVSNIAGQYVRKVMDLIYAPENERARIQAELESHFQEGISGGEDMTRLVERMGDPREVAADFMSAIPLVYAGFWRRLAAFLVDMIMIIFLAIATAVPVVALGNWVPRHPSSLVDHVFGGAMILLVLLGSNACIAMIFAYFPLLEGRFGRTLGKRLLGLQVRSEDGLPAGYGRAILRRLSFYFQILPIDALFIPFTPKRQRGFDILAKTIVVRQH
jgi:uncharacterized RDD family membrane protein YckC